MAIHRYICKQCGEAAESESPIGREPVRPTRCFWCGSDGFRRDYSGVALARPMMAHYNATVGKEVSDMKGFKDDLKRKSEEATLRTGIEHNYEPIDYSDFKPVIEKSEGQGLEVTNRARHAEGKKTIDL